MSDHPPGLCDRCERAPPVPTTTLVDSRRAVESIAPEFDSAAANWPPSPSVGELTRWRNQLHRAGAHLATTSQAAIARDQLVASRSVPQQPTDGDA